MPVDLSSAVSDAYARMQRATVETQLRTLVEPLREAYAARSLKECQALAARWKKIMAAGEVTVRNLADHSERRVAIADVVDALA